MKVAVCCIVKMENNYIREYVEHYKSINVDNIILYDNNDIDGEVLNDAIDDYINNGFVIIENCRGRTSYQCLAYKECYSKYKDKFDWICFFDADEFLDVKDVKVFLDNDKFNNFECIRVPWKIFDDSGIIEINNDFSIKRFTSFKECRQCKSIVNTSSCAVNNMTPHGPLNVNACDPNGNKCMSSNEFICESVKNKKYDIWLNHYMLKTLEEYVTNKMIKLYPDQSKESSKSILQLERFFMINELTEDKLKWLNERGIKLKMKDGKVEYIRDKSYYDKWFL